MDPASIFGNQNGSIPLPAGDFFMLIYSKDYKGNILLVNSLIPIKLLEIEPPQIVFKKEYQKLLDQADAEIMKLEAKLRKVQGKPTHDD